MHLRPRDHTTLALLRSLRLTTGEVAEAMGMSCTNASARLNLMRRTSLVVREPHPGDLRTCLWRAA